MRAGKKSRWLLLLVPVAVVLAACGSWRGVPVTPTPTVDVAQLIADAEAAYANKDWPRAVELLGQLVNRMPDNPTWWARYGQALLAQKRPADALEAFRRAEALEPEKFEHVFGQARAYAAMGRTAEALQALDRAIAMAPTEAALHRWRVRLYLQEGDIDAALVATLVGLHYVPGDKELQQRLQEIVARLTR